MMISFLPIHCTIKFGHFVPTTYFAPDGLSYFFFFFGFRGDETTAWAVANLSRMCRRKNLDYGVINEDIFLMVCSLAWYFVRFSMMKQHITPC